MFGIGLLPNHPPAYPRGSGLVGLFHVVDPVDKLHPVAEFPVSASI